MTKRKRQAPKNGDEPFLLATEAGAKALEQLGLDVSSWQPDVIELELSRGTVKMIVPDVPSLVVAAEGGQVPNGLRELLVSQMKGGQKTKDWEPGPDDLPGIVAFMEVVARAAVIFPVIVPDGVEPDYKQGQIKYGDLTMEDKMGIFQRAVPDEMASAAKFSG